MVDSHEDSALDLDIEDALIVPMDTRVIVVDRDDQAIVGLPVYLFPRRGDAWQSAVTDSDGVATFPEQTVRGVVTLGFPAGPLGGKELATVYRVYPGESVVVAPFETSFGPGTPIVRWALEGRPPASATGSGYRHTRSTCQVDRTCSQQKAQSFTLCLDPQCVEAAGSDVFVAAWGYASDFAATEATYSVHAYAGVPDEAVSFPPFVWQAGQVSEIAIQIDGTEGLVLDSAHYTILTDLGEVREWWPFDATELSSDAPLTLASVFVPHERIAGVEYEIALVHGTAEEARPIEFWRRDEPSPVPVILDTAGPNLPRLTDVSWVGGGSSPAVSWTSDRESDGDLLAISLSWRGSAVVNDSWHIYANPIRSHAGDNQMGMPLPPDLAAAGWGPGPDVTGSITRFEIWDWSFVDGLTDFVQTFGATPVVIPQSGGPVWSLRSSALPE